MTMPSRACVITRSSSGSSRPTPSSELVLSTPASQPWSLDSYGIGFCWTQPLFSVRPTCHHQMAADWYLRSPLYRTSLFLVRAPWWNEEKWRGEDELPACLKEKAWGGEGEDIGFSNYTRLCKAKFLSTKWPAVTTFILSYVTNPFIPPRVTRTDWRTVCY